MEVRFGNLSVSRLEERIGVTFSDEDRKYLEDHRTDTAAFTEEDKLHIFDLPFQVMCGEDIGDEVVNMLTRYNDATPFKKHLMVTTKS